MRIVVLNRDKLENIPPLISVIELLLDLGQQVTVVTTEISDYNKKALSERGAIVVVLPYDVKRSVISKAFRIVAYRKALRLYLQKNKFDYVWVEGGWAVKTGYGIFDKYPFILQLSEMYDYPAAKTVRKVIAKVIGKAKIVVMPEINRATIFQIHYNLKKRPMILPNKPYFYLDGEEYTLCLKKYEKELQIFKEKKVVLYQGIIARERDLTNYIKAVKEMGDDYRFVLLGRDQDGLVDIYKKIDPNIIHIDFIPAPEYLVFTSMAYIGILTYDPSTLNCAYCAPNKIYEYGRYGLPMIGNDIPGLINTIGLYQAGELVDENSQYSIIDAIQLISKNYTYYSKNSRRLYKETDNLKKMSQLLLELS